MLESLGGPNYAGRAVRLLGPDCEGPRCPQNVEQGTWFIEAIGPCEETEEALESSRGPEEYCKLSPLVTGEGIEFVFNNLLDPSSIELVRRRPDNPNLFEVYDWKTQVLRIEGPITRYRGDYVRGGSGQADRVTRMVNLACIDNLAASGQEFGHEDYEDPDTNPCNRWDSGAGAPLKMFASGTITAARGGWDDRAVATAAGHSCSNPETGPDTCCSQCDYILGVQVAKYGLTAEPPGGSEDQPRSVVQDLLARPSGGAIECDPAGDELIECREFVPYVDRTDEVRTYEYSWCPPGQPCDADGVHRLPYYDRLRQTHPDQRPPELERRTAPCQSAADCEEGAGLQGAQCVGVDDEGLACDPAVTADCEQGRCMAPWFVQCRANPDTTGAQGYCVDIRFSDAGAPACLRAPAGFEVCDPQTGRCRDAKDRTKLAVCDLNEDGRYDAAECCGAGGGQGCDPAYQPGLEPIDRYERDANLPEATRDCICPEPGEAMAPGCEDFEASCEGRSGEYAVKFVTRRGGIIYDPAVKGFEWQPADLGGVPRAAAESCAEDRTLIPGRNIEDGWRANDPRGVGVESFEDYDRAMCSGQRYRVIFNEPPGSGEHPREYVRDKVGNTLAGKVQYAFETPQFHVVPGSGFPTDNLRIGACDDFSLRFSNKYDLSPENLGKLHLVEEVADGSSGPCTYATELDGDDEPEMVRRVAGGPECARTREDLGASGCHPPCLVVDVSEHGNGRVSVSVDSAEFTGVLENGHSYHLIAPGLQSLEQASDPELYRAAFWDVCGMPLILGGWRGERPDYTYAFSIDEPKCKEDRDQDGTAFSCDNAQDVYNPDQEDIDRDGVGDVVDLCPTVPSLATNTADSDNDRVGNECDNCRQTITQYNKNAAALSLPGYLQVRNIPFQDDADLDGLGDVCDNCVRVPNCESFGPDAPHRVGSPIAFDDPAVCQRDDDQNMIGDACEGQQDPGAAGPVGLGPDDDFDQDGLPNTADPCPRQPVEPVACLLDEDCPAGRSCVLTDDPDAGGICSHLDTDGDGVGDICDTCPFDANPMQVVDGSMQEDDPDGDFVGSACETAPACEDRDDPRPYGFYEVSASGQCCVTLLEDTPAGIAYRLTGDPLLDPDGLPVTLQCNEDLDEGCRALPARVATRPGVLSLPAGCEQALAAAGYADPADNPRLGPSDFGGDLAALWDNLCFLPQFDQDFDGVGDPCDLCPFDFDPENLPYIDDNNKLWPMFGHVCNGPYSIEVRGCGDDDDPGGGGTGDGTGGGGTTGSLTDGDPTSTSGGTGGT